MARRGRRWFLCGLLLVLLVAGGLSCKEEKEKSPAGAAVEAKRLESEAKGPAKEEARGDTILFEEQEGVEPEDESQRDY